MTSSPRPTPARSSATCRAEVPVLVASTGRSGEPRKVAMLSSNCLVNAPIPSQPMFRASVTVVVDRRDGAAGGHEDVLAELDAVAGQQRSKRTDSCVLANDDVAHTAHEPDDDERLEQAIGADDEAAAAHRRKNPHVGLDA